MEVILYSVKNGVAHIVLNRPEKYNSFNLEMALALQKRLDEAEQDSAVRCILLSGSGKAFCAGQDLGESADPSQLDFEQILKERYNPIVLKIRNMEKPVVCGVNGVAAGAGANLALAGDIVIAKESAAFIQAFINIGLIPDCGGTFMLPRLVGAARAMALCITGEKVSAADAAGMGMICRAVSDERFEEECTAMAERLASLPTRGIALTKKLLNESFSNTLEQQLEQEMRLQVEAGKTNDFKEGVSAFMQKRKPAFQGN
ncbi:enoyl-CoA hydratase-related protein [Rurimicrobium arvi]|uniref:2-(1,2-epoxy-1,2-dihydrophenyl)acetyl-CoA isomerase PaaG n=1 Tax=Rurimicrobium arvi TaxID=2049916 RepID=A0ABP8MEK2_9BACT